MSIVGDLHTLETFDGKTLYFPQDDRALSVYSDYGAPPTDFVTTRRFGQVGVSERDFSLAERMISLRLWNRAACSRQEYWDLRYALHDILRPNRGGPLTLTLIQPEGTKRALRVWPQSGLRFDDANTDTNWLVDEPLEMVAHDPLWFDPAPTIYSTTAPLGLQELVFEADFPILFGSESVSFSTDAFVYTGTWPTWPIITLTGPYSSASITNVAANVAIYMNTPIETGETRIITLTPGSQSIVDGTGANKFGEVDPSSNFIDFRILPDPLAAGGINEIRARMFGATPLVTALAIQFNARYFAI